MNNLDLIRAACIKANAVIMQDVPIPFLNKNKNWQYSYAGEDDINRHSIEYGMRENAIEGAIAAGHFTIRTIRLADVLLAIESKLPLTKKDDWDIAIGCYWVASLLEGEKSWNLRKDDLTEQSENTITFIADLLK